MLFIQNNVPEFILGLVVFMSLSLLLQIAIWFQLASCNGFKDYVRHLMDSAEDDDVVLDKISAALDAVGAIDESK